MVLFSVVVNETRGSKVDTLHCVWSRLTILTSVSPRIPTAVSDPFHKVGMVYTPFSSVFSCSITKDLHREIRR